MSHPYDYSGVKIDGFIINSVRTSTENGSYVLTTTGDNITAEQINQINWEKPKIENLSLYFRCQLPQDYGYIFDDADYCMKSNEWTIKVHTGRQWYGDVYQYQGQIEDLNTAIQEKTAELQSKDETIQLKDSEIDSLNSQLAEADELAISLFESQEEQAAQIEELTAQLAEADELAIALFEAQQAGTDDTNTDTSDTTGTENEGGNE